MNGALDVLHVVPRLHQTGGLEHQAAALARAQAQVGQRVRLVTHAHAGAPALERRDGVETHRLPHGLRRYHPGTWWRSLDRRPDVIHAHGLDLLGARVLALGRRAGVPAVVKLASPGDLDLFLRPGDAVAAAAHDERAPAPGALRRVLRRAAWASLSRAELFLALDDATAARLAALALPHARGSNGVDCTHFSPPDATRRAAARAALGLAQGELVLAGVGRLAGRKDQATLIEALGRLAGAAAQAGGPPAPVGGRAGPVRLLLAGDGPQRGALEARIRAAGLLGRVQLLGELPDVRELLHAADVFVHAARAEGQPNAALEAMACGLPLVLSDIPGHRALQAGEAALLFAPGDAAELAARVAALRDAPARRTALGLVARRQALETCSIEVVAARTVVDYRRLLAPAD